MKCVFRRGIFLTPPLLGYDQDENGDLVINPHEAKIVQLIFYMYLNGSSTQQIADSLTELGCKTKKNNDVWSSSTILQILQNERHCGDDGDCGAHIEDTQKVRDCLKKINTSSKHLLNLINEVWICPNRERTLGCAGERFQPFQSGAERVRGVQADDH